LANIFSTRKNYGKRLSSLLCIFFVEQYTIIEYYK